MNAGKSVSERETEQTKNTVKSFRFHSLRLSLANTETEARERGGPNHRAAEKVVGSRANGKSTESFFLQLAVSATTER